jgi:hypothetical protein
MFNGQGAFTYADGRTIPGKFNNGEFEGPPPEIF